MGNSMRKVLVSGVILISLFGTSARAKAVGFNEVPWVKYTSIDSGSYLGCSDFVSVDAKCSVGLADSMLNTISLYAYGEVDVGSAGEAGAGAASAKVEAGAIKTGFSVQPPLVLKINGGGHMGGGASMAPSQGHNIMAQGISNITLCINGGWKTIWTAQCAFFYIYNLNSSVFTCTTLTSGNITGVKINCIANAWSLTYHSGGSASATNNFGISAMDIEHIGVEETSNLDFGFGNGELKAFPNPFVQSTVISGSASGGSVKDKIKIYDISGKLVKTFPLTTNHSSLTTNITWDGKDNNGKVTEAGIYFVKAQDEKLTKIIKLK
jgi:hypothetical protein